MRLAIFLLGLLSLSFAYSDEQIAAMLKKQANKSGIDARVLYTVAKIESGFNPFIISFVSKTKKNNYGKIATTTIKPYKDRFIVNIESKNIKVLSRIAKELISEGYKVDIGLMQINSQNFNTQEIENMFELETNIAKATEILNQCGIKFGTVKNTIECYNKGYKQGTVLTYFNRFKNSFNRDFGGIL
ncbi:transglycosylase SLT domain-containing protein [Campylobacter jejuni]|nr:transglycosylase SLT domain-containing protein [Campylobacter jejuni]ECP7577846.1 transglycosylase SLT domain-containing protein [Campylobacter jejuni]EEP3556543.1 transglycosylase SLT domain-containing protein [Campylobacter jejuni]EGA8608705.1 transglycosylase SLT domain-containing protein [Campylobacter jejuni]EGA8646425.1 transglycosylase SLT domain-containing protein [Campylobacter jejuni]